MKQIILNPIYVSYIAYKTTAYNKGGLYVEYTVWGIRLEVGGPALKQTIFQRDVMCVAKEMNWKWKLSLGE